MEGGRAGAARAPALFRRANREFEEGEEEDGEDAGSAEGSPPGAREAAPPGRAVPAAAAAEVAAAVADLKRFMAEFGAGLAAVTQAFLKNSGEAAAAAECLQTGQRSDGCPLWSRQDDADLLGGREEARHNLETKYGVENVRKRVGFRTS